MRRNADWTFPLEGMLSDMLVSPGLAGFPSAKPLAKEQAARVYCFNAYLWYRKSLWRRIEIQGGQTQADFDRILRDAFKQELRQKSSPPGLGALFRRAQDPRLAAIRAPATGETGRGGGPPGRPRGWAPSRRGALSR